MNLTKWSTRDLGSYSISLSKTCNIHWHITSRLNTVLSVRTVYSESLDGTVAWPFCPIKISIAVLTDIVGQSMAFLIDVVKETRENGTADHMMSSKAHQC